MEEENNNLAEQDPYEEFCERSIQGQAAPDTPLTAHIRGPFHWLGGKGGATIRKAVLAALPPHTAYVEPFGGTGVILLNKKPVAAETYNDINKFVVNFFRVLIDGDSFRRFYSILRNLPYARELYHEYNNSYRTEEDPVMQAVKFFLVARQAFGGILDHNSWGFGISGCGSQTSSWLTSMDNILLVRRRLQMVQIENVDWRVCLKRYCGPGYLAYCDPPYVSDTRQDAVYDDELTNKDHEELVQALLEYDGAVVLSGYDTPIYKPLEDNGWSKKKVEVVCTCAGRTRTSKLQGNGSCLANSTRIECIWSSPETQRRINERQPTLF